MFLPQYPSLINSMGGGEVSKIQLGPSNFCGGYHFSSHNVQIKGISVAPEKTNKNYHTHLELAVIKSSATLLLILAEAAQDISYISPSPNR